MTQTAVRPTAIDAFVPIEAVRVVGRHRRAMGDLRALADSIADVSLLNPLTLTRDGRLVAGHRRLEACRLLGWQEVPVRFIDSREDAARLLRAELDENTCRKDMLPSELASLGEALYALESEAAKERQRRHGGTAPGRQADTPLSENLSVSNAGGKTTAIVGDALGISDTTYTYLRSVYRAATDTESPEAERVLAQAALDKMDRTGTVQPAAKEYRARLRAKRDADEAKAAALADPPPAPDEKPSEPESKQDEDWVPGKGDSSQRAVAQRRDLIRRLAGKGWSSQQIGQHLDILDLTVRRIARNEGIAIPADDAMGRGTRKSIDSNRIVRETVSMLEGLDMGLDLIRFEDLDPGEIENWTASLSKSIGVLTRLNKRLKGMVQ